jgi:FixJ family two-component response regulator
MQNVLVIDDDVALRDNIGLMLETEGFTSGGGRRRQDRQQTS